MKIPRLFFPAILTALLYLAAMFIVMQDNDYVGWPLMNVCILSATIAFLPLWFTRKRWWLWIPAGLLLAAGKAFLVWWLAKDWWHLDYTPDMITEEQLFFFWQLPAYLFGVGLVETAVAFFRRKKSSALSAPLRQKLNS